MLALSSYSTGATNGFIRFSTVILIIIKNKMFLCILLLVPYSCFKDTLKAFDDFKDDFKTSNKVYEVMFFVAQKHVYSESVFNTLYIEIKSKCKQNFLRTK